MDEVHLRFELQSQEAQLYESYNRLRSSTYYKTKSVTSFRLRINYLAEITIVTSRLYNSFLAMRF